MEFEPVNVLEEEGAVGEMKRLGIPLVPATALGGKVVHGWNPAALAALVGVDFDATPALSPTELGEKLDGILASAQALLERVTEGQLELKHPQRPRTFRGLAFHVFRLGAAFVDCMERGEFRREWLEEDIPPQLQTPRQLVAYGGEARRRISAWMNGAPGDRFQGAVSTYYGEQSVHLLLERTAWHAGQHLRQLRDLLARDGAAPADLPAALFEGLPMPESLW